MTNLFAEEPITAAVLTLITGICILGLSGLHSEDDRSAGYGLSMRTACAGLLVICLSGILFGNVMLHAEGLFALGVLLLALTVPSGLIFAFAAMTPFSHFDDRLPTIDTKHSGPWG